ncbi:hypothetical protein ACFW7J_05855 [Streptomyces sp. NPDC059525]|uniref:hypothetical protein n=1 Tax=Streptomyces sp. NPDC059525 TaxID=3346857 RepID=UPI0036B743EC
MDDQGEVLVARVRAVLAEAGFEETATGAEGVHLIRHARGVMVAWMPEEISRPRRRGPAAAAGLMSPPSSPDCGTPSDSPWQPHSAQPA